MPGPNTSVSSRSYSDSVAGSGSGSIPNSLPEPSWSSSQSRIMSTESGEPGSEDSPAGASAGARELSGVPSTVTGWAGGISRETTGAGSAVEPAVTGSSSDSVRTGRWGCGTSGVARVSAAFGTVEDGWDRSDSSGAGVRTSSGASVSASVSAFAADGSAVTVGSPDGSVWDRGCGMAFGEA
ncbi:hypothetical protein GCM10010280_43470 [Streptomyces pilosus]|uniref:Uncharacterized protein n=1 Tax=Streptomyces pilosus TaxID=28893 RepID=A0A918EYN6_9ACTN|nr:hypothetical protein GCM10010280_43470 [Streptomyces pilosus]